MVDLSVRETVEHFLDGVETGWENKYSTHQVNALLIVLVTIQCQAYMMAWDLDQWVLAGMWQGKPVYKLIKKDVEIQKRYWSYSWSCCGNWDGIKRYWRFPGYYKYSAQK